MKLVVDSNVLFAAIIKDSFTRSVIKSGAFELVAPRLMIEEIQSHRAEIAEYADLSIDETTTVIDWLLRFVRFVPDSKLRPHWRDAATTMRSRDPADTAFLAVYHAEKADAIWSNDKAFIDIPGVRRWSTRDVKAHLLS